MHGAARGIFGSASSASGHNQAVLAPLERRRLDLTNNNANKYINHDDRNEEKVRSQKIRVHSVEQPTIFCTYCQQLLLAGAHFAAKVRPLTVAFLTIFLDVGSTFFQLLSEYEILLECSQRAGEALGLGVHNVPKQIILLYPHKIILNLAQQVFFALSLSGHCLRSIVMSPNPYRGNWSVFF